MYIFYITIDMFLYPQYIQVACRACIAVNLELLAWTFQAYPVSACECMHSNERLLFCLMLRQCLAPAKANIYIYIYIHIYIHIYTIILP